MSGIKRKKFFYLLFIIYRSKFFFPLGSSQADDGRSNKKKKISIYNLRFAILFFCFLRINVSKTKWRIWWTFPPPTTNPAGNLFRSSYLNSPLTPLHEFFLLKPARIYQGCHQQTFHSIIIKFIMFFFFLNFPPSFINVKHISRK